MTGDFSVRSHPVLAAAAPAPCRLEAQRRRNTVQHLRRERPAKAEQYASLVGDSGRRLHRQRADRRLRCDMREGRSDRSNAPAQPPDSARQGDVRPAQRIGGGFHALGRRRYDDAVFDRGEQAGQPGGEEVRQEAKRSAPLRAVPPSDPQPLGRHPGITAMAGKRAAARRMQRAAGQSGIAPFTVPDVRVDARQCAERELH